MPAKVPPVRGYKTKELLVKEYCCETMMGVDTVFEFPFHQDERGTLVLLFNLTEKTKRISKSVKNRKWMVVKHCPFCGASLDEAKENE
jgi:hypothetical protein